MQLRNSHIAQLFLLCAATAACNKNDLQREPESQDKTPIELSIGMEENTATKVITDETSSMTDFTSGTHIFMLMKADNGSSQKYTTTRGKAASENKVIFENDDQTTRVRYWEDAFARDTKLSIWALACNGMGHLGGTGTDLTEDKNMFWNGTSYDNNTVSTVSAKIPWRAGMINARLIGWNVPHGNSSAQDETVIKNRDLLFSNNIAVYTGESGTDRRLKFDSGEKKFTPGKLVFYHALSKITVNIKKGVGFTGDNDFRFTNQTNIKLSNFNIWGQFNAEAGEFISTNTSHEAISSMWNTTGTTPQIADTEKPAYILQALVLPAYKSDGKNPHGSEFFETSTDVMMDFYIDGNLYQIKSKDLFKAIQDVSANNIANDATSIPMEAGKHYIFSFTVGKTQIDKISAQIVDWDEVAAADVSPSNARIQISLEERGTPVANNVDIYRAADNADTVTDTWDSYNWFNGYVGNKNVYGQFGDPLTWKMQNVWYWPNNQTYYHFRAIMPNGTTVSTDTATNPYKDYVTLTSAKTFSDILWGAPMRDIASNEETDPFTWTYSLEDGFGINNAALGDKNQIYQAIGPTDNHIKLTLFHMMSDISFTINTSDGDDKVELCHDNGAEANPRYTHTRLELLNYHNEGRVLLGTAAIKTAGDAGTVEIPFDSATDNTQFTSQKYKWGAVPQNLTSVQLQITTPDNNVYIVDLANVKVYNSETKIQEWHPGNKYNYNFTLKKKGITNMQATIVDWGTVEAGGEDVTIN